MENCLVLELIHGVTSIFGLLKNPAKIFSITIWSVSPSVITPKLIILKILRKSSDIAPQKSLG